MQKNRFFPSAILLLSLLVSNIAHAVPGTIYQRCGQEALTQIESDFGLSGALFAQSLTDRFPAYAWGQGIMFGALVAAAKVDSSYLDDAEAQANELHSRYWCTSNGKSGYNAGNNSCGDRYYDDNAWIALVLMELYEITGNATYLNRAKGVLIFCMSGENSASDTPNGGIRWHESNTSGASVCSTAPTLLANLMVYQATGIEQYLTDGARLYHWLAASNLRDSTGIYHETNQGALGYQTAVVLQGALRLYRITGDTSYLTEAQHLALSMETRFVNGQSHALHQAGKWGGHDMTNAMVDLYEVDHNPRWLNVAGGYLEYLYTTCRDASGRYPTNWNNTGGGSELIDNASAARAFWKMAQTSGGSSPRYPVMLFENCSYGGWSMGLLPGSYTLSSLKANGIGDNCISSVMVASGYKVTFYGNDNFTSSTLIKTADAACLSDNGWDNRASSLIIDGCVPTAITPYLTLNNGSQTQTPRANLEIGDSITLSPAPSSGGSWRWLGPAGFSAATQEIIIDDIQTTQAGDYIATFTNSCGAESNLVFTLSVVPAVTLYQHCSFGGWSAKFRTGAYTAAEMAAWGGRDNDASSARIEPGYRVTFYADDNFQGAAMVKTAADSCFVDDGWNDRLSSMVIEEDPEPAAYWQFNDAAGLLANDSSAYNRDGTLVNMDSGNWALGKRCAGLLFDGVNDYVEINGFKGVTGAHSRTCSAWIKTSGSSANAVIVDWGTPIAEQRWLFGVFSTGQLTLYTWPSYIKTNRTVTDNQWHHVAAVLTDDGTPNVSEIKLYVDGQLQVTTANSTQAINTVSAGNVLIGAFNNAQTKAGYFHGAIDEVLIYNRPLSAEEIQDMYLADALVGDLSPNGVVDIADFAAIAQFWQKPGSCNGDLTCDCTVDIDDLMLLADEWLMRVE